MAKTSYKNLLFDLGGVILDLKREDCVRAFEALGMTDAANVFGEYSQTGVFLALEEGQIGVDEFHSKVKKDLPCGVTDEQIDEAFGCFLVGIPMARLDALMKLREKYNVYLLSNTNPIHINGRIKQYFCAGGKSMSDYFDGVVLSYEAKAAKPSIKIFEYAMSHLGIIPQETLFLDDSQKNLDAALTCGFGTALVKPGEEFVEVLKRCIAM